MFAAEKQLDITKRSVDLAAREQLGDEFLALNPRGTVPVLLTDNGDALSENLAIAVYLEAIEPAPNLLGATANEKASIAMWGAICEQHGFAAISESVRNASPTLVDRALPGPIAFAQLPELVERGKRRVEVFFAMLDEQLAGHDYLARASFSYADLTAFAAVDFAYSAELTHPAQYPAVHRWHQRVAARPSAAA